MEQIVNNGGVPPMVPPPTATPSPIVTPPMGNTPIGTPTMDIGDDMGAGSGAFFKKDSGIKAFFNDINILDVTIMAFVVGGILYSVQYFRFMMMLEKSGYADLSTKIQKLESSMTAQKAELNASGNGRMDSMRKKPMMRLG